MAANNNLQDLAQLDQDVGPFLAGVRGAIANARRANGNLRRGNGVRNYHFQRLSSEMDIISRSHVLETKYHRLVHLRTFFPEANDGDINRFEVTMITRDVVREFCRFTRLRDEATVHQILDLFIENIQKVHEYTENELDFIFGLHGVFPMEPVPAPAGPLP